jgi:hypothetical protein
MTEKIQDVLMNRDGLTLKEANESVKEAKKALRVYLANRDIESAGNICQEFFGLEPDYIDQLL